MDPLTKAWLKVVIDGQAYLYSMVHDKRHALTDEQRTSLENDWKQESEKLVRELLLNNEPTQELLDDDVAATDDLIAGWLDDGTDA